MGKRKSEQCILIPDFLGESISAQVSVIQPRCDFCKEVACETAAMSCAQCSSQTCGSQCSAAQCGTCQTSQCITSGQCGICQKCQNCMGSSCLSACQGCQTYCETGCLGCMGGCMACESCQGCQSACERSTQSPSTGAALALSGGKGTLTWTISGLSSAFNTTNYKSVGITRDKFTVGGVSSISGVAASKNAPSSGSSTSVSQTIDYPPGTYTFWGFAQTPSGGNPQYWPAGSDTVTVLPKNINFDWDYAGRNPTTGVLLSGTQKQGGLGIYIGANEWNRLVDATNEKMGTGIPYVAKNSEITAAVVNRVASALGVQSVTAGRTEISAAFFNQLRAAVNS